MRNYQEQYRINNHKKLVEAHRKYNAEHKAERQNYEKEYRDKLKNDDEMRKAYNKRHSDYCRRRKNEDPVYRLKVAMRSMIYNAFTKNRYSKKYHAEAIIGCSLKEFIDHLHETYYKTYGEQYCGQPVHIDHIIPLSSAKTEDRVKKLCHYSNLQLLKPKDNLKKQADSDYIYVKRS